MADREKVIKGLECKLNANYDTCKDCQYLIEELAEDYPEFEYFCNRSQIEADALELLQAQEPRVMTMDDLISRKAARTAVYGYEMQTGIAEMPLEFAHNKIDKVPSVPAVPLDKLCEFLEKCGADSYCGTCKQIMGECFTDGRGCGSEHFWKELLTKWMEEQHESD